MAHESKRVSGVDLARGIASLAVCYFHLTSYRFPTPDGPLYQAVRLSGSHGWLGVDVFFVLSGFIIPYSLHRAGYELRYYPHFILKRLVRLDPPYLVSIVLIIVLALIHTSYTGRAMEVEGAALSWTRVLLHLGYLNMFFNEKWLNPAFWTLAIELQYYLLMGLLFPLFGRRERFIRLGALTVFVVPVFLAQAFEGAFECGRPAPRLIFYFAFLFLMGIVTYQRWTGLVGRREWLILQAVAAVGSFLTVGLLCTVTGLFAVILINTYRWKSAVVDFFGKISYSLYLVHWPVGHTMISLLGANLAADTDVEKIFLLAFTHVVCFACAYVLYLVIERPSQRASSLVSYGRTGSDSRAQETSALAPAR